MKTDEIKKLLDAFYEGNTSPEEELLLKNYFNSSDVANELLDEKEIFLGFFEHSPVVVPNALEAKLERLIDTLDKENKKKKLTVKNMVTWLSVAASVAILISVGFHLNKGAIQGDNQALVESVNSKMSEKEVVEVENALLLLAANFNKGLGQIDEVKGNFDRTSNILNETFK